MKDFVLYFEDYSYSYNVKGFEPVRAIRNVIITEVLPGEIICIIGPNGSGKSTFLDAVVGRLNIRKDQGRIKVKVRDEYVSPRFLRIAYIPQNPFLGLVPDLSIVENLVFRRRILDGVDLKTAISEEIYKEIESFLVKFSFGSLTEKLKMPPDALSGGQQQIINLLSAIFAEPDLIVLDEPTSKLDEVNRIRLWNLLVEAALQKGVVMLCASHDYDIIERVADRVVTFSEGNVVDEQIRRKPKSPRFAGDIRCVDTPEELPIHLRNVSEEWWRPAPEALFGICYQLGDDSLQGYLASKRMDRIARTSREVNGILRLADLGNPCNVEILDVPCGWGRHAIELAKLGCKVIGIDLSNEYINEAIGSAKKEGITNVEFHNGDMCKLPLLNGCCDLIINMWTSFGFFDDRQNKMVLKEFNRVLRSKGRVLLHSDLNPARVSLGIFDEPPIRDLRCGEKLEVKEYYCKSDKRIYGSWKISNNDKTHNYKIAVYSKRDLKIMAEETGFVLSSVFGSFDKSEELLTVKSQEYIVILTKMNHAGSGLVS